MRSWPPRRVIASPLNETMPRPSFRLAPPPSDHERETKPAMGVAAGARASLRRQPVDRGVQDMGDGPGAVAGDDHEIELDELAASLLEQRADAPARDQRLADARAAEMAYDAAGVDPRAEAHVETERLVGLIEEVRRMDPAVT